VGVRRDTREARPAQGHTQLCRYQCERRNHVLEIDVLRVYQPAGEIKEYIANVIVEPIPELPVAKCQMQRSQPVLTARPMRQWTLGLSIRTVTLLPSHRRRRARIRWGRLLLR